MVVIVGGWTLAALLVTGIVLSALFQRNAERGFEELLQAHMFNLMSAIVIDEEGQAGGDPNLGDPRFSRPASGWYWVVAIAEDPTTPILHSASLSGEPLVVESVEQVPFNESFRRIYRIAGLGGELNRRLEAQLFLGEDETLYQLMVAGNEAALQNAIDEFNRQLMISLGLLALGTIASTFFLVKVGLRPLNNAARALGEVRDGRREEVAGEYPEEVSPLVTEINALIAANSKVVERARTQVGNLAHSLKTPLAVMRNEAASLPQQKAAIISSQLETMQQQIQTYLDRARIAARRGSVSTRTPVLPVIEKLLRVMQKLSPDKAFEVTGAEHVDFRGDKQDLEEIMGNLLENAARHAASRVSVVLSALSRNKADFVCIAVHDDGPGIAPSEWQNALKRGERLDETRPGTGLGLSIVKDVAEEYDGKVELGHSHLGGLKVEVSLPRFARRH